MTAKTYHRLRKKWAGNYTSIEIDQVRLLKAVEAEKASL